MFVEDVFAARNHLPGRVDLVFGVKIDAGVGIHLVDLTGRAEALGYGHHARFDQPLVGGGNGQRQSRQILRPPRQHQAGGEVDGVQIGVSRVELYQTGQNVDARSNFQPTGLRAFDVDVVTVGMGGIEDEVDQVAERVG